MRTQSPIEAKQQRRLVLVLMITTTFFVVEFIGARISKSTAIRADALHLLMDVFALLMSLAAMRMSRLPPRGRYTYGYLRAEPLAALLNALLVLGTAVEITREGIEVLRGEDRPDPSSMLIVAVLALIANGLSAWLIHGAMPHAHHDHDHGEHGHGEHGHGGHGHDDGDVQEHAHRGQELNLRGAWLHLMGDALGALAALCAAIVIRQGGPSAIDPIAGFLVALILFVGGLRLVRDALRVLFEGAPKHLQPDAIRAFIAQQAGVESVERLRVWTLGSGQDALTAQVKGSAHAHALEHALVSKYGLAEVTVQVDHAHEHGHATPDHAAHGH
jgi:cobalt-zinc-cadmium efflux system protein